MEQAAQDVELLTVEYAPFAQLEQLDDSDGGAYIPAGHIEHPVDAANATAPAAQFLHSEAPLLAWNVPITQLMQSEDAGID